MYPECTIEWQHGVSEGSYIHYDSVAQLSGTIKSSSRLAAHKTLVV